mgnify:CR=1 FL=1
MTYSDLFEYALKNFIFNRNSGHDPYQKYKDANLEKDDCFFLFHIEIGA